MRRVDWAGRMRLAAERFGIGPDGFWRLSLAEWRALVESEGPAVLGRARLSALMAEHPDGRGGEA